MRILVAGGAGFLGSNLCERLLKDNHEVICLDKYGINVNDNVKNLLKYKNFKNVAYNIIYPVYRKEKFDQVYNFACFAAPGKYRQDPINTVKLNIHGTINLLNFAKDNHAKFFQASTIRIYDEVDHLGIDACYIEGKKFAESIIMDYKRLYNMDVRIARLFSTYGPNMDLNDSRVIPQFITKALKGEDLIIYGTGKQIDIFCYVDDMIDEIINYMSIDSNEPSNVGKGVSISIYDLAKVIIDLTNSKSKIVCIENEKDYKDNLVVIKEKLPLINIYKGLEKTINYYRKKMGL